MIKTPKTNEFPPMPTVWQTLQVPLIVSVIVAATIYIGAALWEAKLQPPPHHEIDPPQYDRISLMIKIG